MLEFLYKFKKGVYLTVAISNKETFEEKIKKIHKNNITLIDPYIGSNKPIRYRCNRCNKISPVKRAADLVSKKNLSRKHSCRHCFWEKKHEDYREKARERLFEKLSLHPSITFIKEHRHPTENKLVAELKCLECAHLWKSEAGNITKRASSWKGCPKCWKNSSEYKKGRALGLSKSRGMRSDEFQKKFLKILEENPSILPLSPYIDSKTSMEFKCMECTSKWSTAPSHITNSNSGCPHCKSGSYQAQLDYENMLPRLRAKGIIPLENFKGSVKKIKHHCLRCNEPWSVRPSSLRKGSGCPNCNMSRGENEIKAFLVQNQIPFIPQWIEHECKYRNKLSFDFYIPEINTVIEFQGIQHEKFTPYFHRDETSLIRQQKRDAIKREYCLKNEINLIEIWHYEFDKINEILDKALSPVHTYTI